MKSLSNESDLARITVRLRHVQPTDTARWGLMSSSEMICHLRGSFQMAMGELAPGITRNRLPPSLVKLLALRIPLPWPKNYETVPALKRNAPAVQVTSFQADLDAAAAKLICFSKEHKQRVDHPYMGAMSTADWMRWGYLHTDHHLRQFGR